MRTSTAAFTHPGLVRTRNEDAHAVLRSDVLGTDIEVLLVVADGLGGHAAGDLASRVAVDEFTKEFASSNDSITPHTLNARVERAFQAANVKVLQTAEHQQLYGMGTTLSALLIAGSSATIASIGDSRVFLLRQGELRQLTVDDTLVQEQVLAGELTVEQAAVHPRRHMVTKAIGIEPFALPAISTVDVLSDDRYLLCTDGVHGMMTNEQIAQNLASGVATEISEHLISTSNDRGGTDNSTAVVAIVHGE